MAKRRKSHKSPTTITVRRVGGPEGVAGKVSRYRSSGPSRALVRATGAVSSARKAAARAGQLVRSEPTRVGVGIVGGNVVGKVAGDMIHDAGLKKPDGVMANHEALVNLGVGVGGLAVAVGASLMKGGGVGKRYVTHVAANLASHSLGEAAAIDRQNRKPLTPVKPLQGTDGSDPFRSDVGDTGASQRRERIQRRRQALATKVAGALRAEDPEGAGTEGLELDAYVGELLEDTAGEVEGMNQCLEEVGVLPLLAAKAAPQLISSLSTLLKLMDQKGAQDLAQQAPSVPVTAAVLELEGIAPEDLDTGAKKTTARKLRQEKRELKKDIRQQKRQNRKEARTKKREGKLQQQVIELRQEARPVKQQRPLIVQMQREREQEPEEDLPLIIIADDDDVQDVSEGRPLRRLRVS